MPTYIVERYWPGVTKEHLAQAVARSQEVIALMNQDGIPVRYLRSTLVPGDEVVFSLYEGHPAAPRHVPHERERHRHRRHLFDKPVLTCG